MGQLAVEHRKAAGSQITEHSFVRFELSRQIRAGRLWVRFRAFDLSVWGLTVLPVWVLPLRVLRLPLTVQKHAYEVNWNVLNQGSQTQTHTGQKNIQTWPTLIFTEGITMELFIWSQTSFAST